MTKKHSEGRRAFLKTMAFFGGAVVGAPLLQKTSAAGKAPPVTAETTGQGYRETEHVIKYYEKAKI